MSDIAKQVAAWMETRRNEERAMATTLKQRGLDTKGLNPFLVKKQGLTQTDIDLVTCEHARKDVLFQIMEALDPEVDTEELHECVGILEEIEFAMQRAWKFEKDADRHSWWYRAPHCRCPRMDNSDPLMPNRITRQDCPLHGWKQESD